jgi:small neutral amino acid transporter SnatA (MarC family)
MGISFRDFLLGRNLDRLTRRQRATQYAVTWLTVIPAVVVLRWLGDLLFGWDADLETTLQIAGGMLVGAAAITVILLLREPRPDPGPQLELTEEMSRRIR